MIKIFYENKSTFLEKKIAYRPIFGIVSFILLTYIFK